MKLLDIINESEEDPKKTAHLKRVEDPRKAAHIKRVENVYKFLKKGTFEFKTTNNVGGYFYKIYSYELSDKHSIVTEEMKRFINGNIIDGDIIYRSVIYCEATVLDTNREDIHKLRPKMINNKINYFFQKYKVDEIILERVDGDIERESVSYYGDW